jgi:hypothetical protein
MAEAVRIAEDNAAPEEALRDGDPLDPDDSRPFSRKVYATALRDPLPNIRIPLREGEEDVVLALQPLVDRVYQLGRYWQEDFRELPGPALTETEAIWVADRIREAGLE